MTHRAADAPALARTLTVRDLVLFNIAAVMSIRWLATAAAAGPSSLLLWVAAGLLFFIPQGLAVARLSARYPEEGGIYRWTRRAFGEQHGFFCGWCYWVNNVLYYPSLLVFVAAIAPWAFGAGESGLGDRLSYVLPVTLVGMWLAVGLNVIGVQTGRWLQNVGGSAVFIPAGLVIVLGLYAVATRAPATAITPQSILPSLDDLNRLNFWASIPFAYAGLELAATLAGEVKNPERSLPRSVFLTAPIVATVYVLGTAALLWMVPPERLNVVTAILQGIASGVSDLPALRWVVPVAAAAITINVIGAVGAWLTGSARVAFAVGLDRYAPRGFARIHPRWGTPYVAILVQATLSTILLLVSVLGKGTRVETLYLVLLDTMLLVYFIPYIYLFLCYLRESSGSALVWLTAISGIFVTVFAMVVACIPPPDSHYHLVKVVGGVLGFLVLGGVLYWRADRRSGMEIREAA
ncbi:MAG TPA: APC family permease [Gemmatimonadales bacterium]|jgi:amino acid transporter|nr:APC family permease [Gemmatimonadales bacterium]